MPESVITLTMPQLVDLAEAVAMEQRIRAGVRDTKALDAELESTAALTAVVVQLARLQENL